jgi:hypothetical protein
MHHAFHALVDYAGLFPPASRTMAEAAAEYAEYRQGPDRAMLGRFVVAALRLDELGEVATREGLPGAGPGWELSVVLGAHHPDELERIASFQAAWPDGFVVAAVEAKVPTVGSVPVVVERLDPSWECFLEVPHQVQYGELIAAIAEAGVGAKLRTGGTTPDAFPSARVLTRFLMAVTRHRVPYKLTAGLHHPWRGAFPLTYARDSASHVMHGYLNVMVAAALLRAGADGETAEAVVSEANPAAFVHDGEGITWRDQRVTLADLAAARVDGFRGFGSCSFREPVDELPLGVAS